MFKWIGCLILSLSLLFFIPIKAYSQKQDVEFHLKYHLLSGKKILKVKRDFYDPYLWVLAQNNEVYRVNSLTQQIDDYTATFSAYHDLRFVDIAGRCLDSVYIATNSTNIIRFENNQLHVIQASDGIPGTVNSVGMENGTQYGVITKTTYVLLIGTDAGFRYYDTNTTKITPLDYPGKARIYEATYRAEMFEDSTAAKSDFVNMDTIQYQPVTFKMDNSGSQVVEYLYEGGKSFGYNINTADDVYNGLSGYNEVFTSIFWGNSRGMFQNVANWSYYSIFYPWYHYLDGINVNKITNIYGLTSLGNDFVNFPAGFIQQNMLVGTDKGLYFSKSCYLGETGTMGAVSMLHDDELGNMPINDICVNNSKLTMPICENGAWLAANDGLYFVIPDYTAVLKNKQLKAISFKDFPGKAEAQLCTGSVTAVVDSTIYSGDIIKWYKDGVELPGENSTSLIIRAAGDYNAVFYDPCSDLSVTSNHLKADIAKDPVFTFNYPDELKSCAGNPIVLNVQGNAAYQYRWYKDGALTGITADSFTASQSGKYNVEVSSCAGSWVPSKTVQVDFISLPEPQITKDKPAYCISDQATLALNIVPDDSYIINWSRDGTPLTNYQDMTSITTNTAGSYTVTVNSKLVGSCTQVSSPLNIEFEPPPTVSIQQIVNTTLCDGQTIALKVTHDNGTVKWSTGESTDQISVLTSGAYKATVTSAAGCTADAGINVQFFANPVLAIPDASLCENLKEAVTLEAPTGYSKYLWNGLEGSNTFTVNKPETVTLSITDVNGCQASQTIIVSSKCPNIPPSNISIPNTFTPNGDGINDTWVISGVDNDPTIAVRVFNRYGTEVYKSTGYGIPWNGQYGGKKLPPGVYYYIISTNNNKQTYSGSLTIIY
jgi:gliding motility-associated-like protein